MDAAGIGAMTGGELDDHCCRLGDYKIINSCCDSAESVSLYNLHNVTGMRAALTS